MALPIVGGLICFFAGLCGARSTRIRRSRSERSARSQGYDK